MNRALVIDDEEVIQDVIKRALQRHGISIREATSLQEARERLTQDYDLVFLDLRLPDGNGLDVLPLIRERLPYTPVIVLTAYGTVEAAVRALKLGAFDFLEKPFTLKDFENRVKEAIKFREVYRENIELKKQLDEAKGFGHIIGKTQRMIEVYEAIGRVANADVTVLIEGESGTGKEMVAREIHKRSGRSGKFVVFHCGNISPDLVESHLFGHRKGAFTGATQDKRGFIEEAEGGTLLLDDITTLPWETQAKLLRFLETREFVKLGETRSRRSSARILVASNEPLKKAVEEGKFREDLFYRINVVSIELPPLRERKEDIPLFVFHFLKEFSEKHNKRIKGIKEDAMKHLMNYSWPGNVRELKNALESAVILAKDEWIGVENLPDWIARNKPISPSRIELGKKSYRELLEEFERTLILKALQEAGGVQKKAAELLGMNPSTLNMAMKRLGLK